MLAASSMGSTAFQKGLGAIHSLSHPVGAIYNTHHGLTNAVFMPYVLQRNKLAIEKKIISLSRYLNLEQTNFDGFLKWILDLRTELKIPHTLKELIKDDEKFGTVVFMGRSDLPEGFIWELFNDQKNQFAKGDMVYGYRDHIPGLPPTCYEAMYVAQSYEFVQCIKDDVIIFVMTNYGDSRSVMKQILNKMDGQPSLPDIGGGGCLIATATFGSEMAPQVQLLRELRDNTVLQTESGTSFMAVFNQFYYSFSPYIADYERENPAFKETVKLALTPLLTSLTLLQYVDIDSESEMLGYGIGVILLNIGMYFVAPAVLIMAVRKRI